MFNTIKGLEYIEALTWERVFDFWRVNEADRPNWIAHYQEAGFSSWEEWRMQYVKPLRLEDRRWDLFRVPNPELLIPLYRGGPFRSWIEKFSNGVEAPTFAELVKHPIIQKHAGIQQIADVFPSEKVITGVVTDGGVVIVEGMHRCCAIALAAARGEPIASEVLLALAQYENWELPPVGHFKKT